MLFVCYSQMPERKFFVGVNFYEIYIIHSTNLWASCERATKCWDGREVIYTIFFKIEVFFLCFLCFGGIIT